MPRYIEESKKGIIIKLHVQPKASRNKICGPYGDRLKISITAPPVDGKANRAVQDFLAKFFRISKSMVELISGQSSRQKNFLLKDISLKDVLKRLES